MDETLPELEAELKSRQLRAPSRSLLDRIDHELAATRAREVSDHPRDTTATSFKTWKWFGWRAAGLAASLAVVAVFIYVRVTRPHPANLNLTASQQPAAEPLARAEPVRTPHRERYQPVAASNVLYDLHDEGPVTVAGDSPGRRLRYRYLDTYTWRNPQGNASLKWSVPRDEIRVIPATMN